jgi:hypothetical protein
MKVLLRVSLLLLAATCVQAQALPIHDHPQKTAYASPDEWPCDSAQAHWFLHPGHTHVDLCFPRYAELAGPIVVKFAVKLFHTPGIAGDVIMRTYKGATLAHDIVWDATGTSTPPPLIGDPNALKTWTGHFTIEPDPGTHGWYAISIEATTVFENGESSFVQLLEPFWSMVDPSADVPAGEFNAPGLSTQAVFNSLTHTNYGTQIVKFTRLVNPVPFSRELGPLDLLPIAPLSGPWPPSMAFTKGYGAKDLPHAVTSEVLDLDLHNGIDGLTLTSIESTDENDGAANLPLILDPAVIAASVKPAGSPHHKLAVRRDQFTVDGEEHSTTLLVIDVDVADGTLPAPLPPPPVCTPPAMLMNGQCMTPPPPPPPAETFTTVCTVQFQSGSAGHTQTVSSCPSH